MKIKHFKAFFVTLPLSVSMSLPVVFAESSCTNLSYYMSISTTRSQNATSYTRSQSTDVLTGGEVSKLQAFLKSKGYMDASTVTTGRYGALTAKAVKNFQAKLGLSQTGATGPLTRTKMAELSCGNQNINTNPVQSNITTQTPSVTAVASDKNFSLLADDQIVVNGLGISAPNGEAIFVWKNTNNPVSCTLAGKDVQASGGPMVFKNLSVNTSYTFSCLYKDIKPDEINFFVSSTNSSTANALSKNQQIDVFLIGGQSNAVGQSIDSQSDVPVTENIARYYNSKLQGVNKLGAWYSFGKEYTEKTGHAIVFIPTSYPGTGASSVSDSGNGNWGETGTLLGNSSSKLTEGLSALKVLGYNPSFKGILWVQGENDAMAINGTISNNGTLYSKEQYKTALTSIISRYRTSFGPRTPFFIFQTGFAVNESSSGYIDVQNAQREVATADPNTKIVFTGAATFPRRGLMWDEYHYLPLAYKEMGKIGAGEVVTSGLLSLPTITTVSSPLLTLVKGDNSVVNNSSIRRTDYLKVRASDLSKVNATKYYLNMGYQNPVTKQISWYLKGPYTQNLEDTVAGFGFDSGVYYIQIKGCDDNGVCSNFASTPSVTSDVQAISLTVLP